jgi:hypothetical protein
MTNCDWLLRGSKNLTGRQKTRRFLKSVESEIRICSWSYRMVIIKYIGILLCKQLYAFWTLVKSFRRVIRTMWKSCFCHFYGWLFVIAIYLDIIWLLSCTWCKIYDLKNKSDIMSLLMTEVVRLYYSASKKLAFKGSLYKRGIKIVSLVESGIFLVVDMLYAKKMWLLLPMSSCQICWRACMGEKIARTFVNIVTPYPFSTTLDIVLQFRSQSSTLETQE